MQGHFHTLTQALKSPYMHYLKQPSCYKVTHRLNSVNDLTALADDYDLFLLDRDCTLQPYHSKERVPEFEETLQKISPKAELISNSKYDEFLVIKRIFSDLFPVSKLVRFTKDKEFPHLLRFVDGNISIWQFDIDKKTLEDRTCDLRDTKDWLKYSIIYEHNKPDPLGVIATVYMNIQLGNIPKKPRVLMVGDKYTTDIAAGNIAKILLGDDIEKMDTAIVKPYKPFSDPWYLTIYRYLVDIPGGYGMNKISKGKDNRR